MLEYREVALIHLKEANWKTNESTLRIASVAM